MRAAANTEVREAKLDDSETKYRSPDAQKHEEKNVRQENGQAQTEGYPDADARGPSRRFCAGVIARTFTGHADSREYNRYDSQRQTTKNGNDYGQYQV